MRFDSPGTVELLTAQMRFADTARASNRAMLNDLYNGFPPYTPEEVEQNQITSNFNDLSGPGIIADARRKVVSAITSTPEFLTIDLDYGRQWEKNKWGAFMSGRLNKYMVGKADYFHLIDSTSAGTVLHGIGPEVWDNRENWCPRPYGIEDIFVPSGTFVDCSNLPFFAVYKKFSAAQLWKLTHGPKQDPAWNMPLVKAAIKWVTEQGDKLIGTIFPDIRMPEKWSERIKEDGGWYSGDHVPTIDTFDFYYYDDSDGAAGWRRRIIIDAWSAGSGGIVVDPPPSTRVQNFSQDKWLYNSGDRIYAKQLNEIMYCQFADCSPVPPFRWHSVRSLGFMLYAISHIQNRLRCRVNDAVFESLMQFYRVTNPADAQRAVQVNLVDRAVIPEGINFVSPNDRWKYDMALAELGLDLNRRSMADNSAAFTSDFDFQTSNQPETATRTMAKVNSSAAMLSAILGKVYTQRKYELREIVRRFCIKGSRDADVRAFRLDCLKEGIPEEALNPERMEVNPVRVVGSGNKMLQQAMADKEMAVYPLLDSNGQRMALKGYLLANSDDPNRPDAMVPDVKSITDDALAAQNSFGTLMVGGDVGVKDGVNHEDAIKALLYEMALVITRISQSGGVGTPQDVAGLGNVAGHIQKHIAKLAQDKKAKQKVRKYGDDLGKLMNQVKAFAQRQAEMAQKAQQQNGHDPEVAGKVQADIIKAQSKAKIGEESAAQKAAQKQVAFEAKLQQDSLKTQAEIAKQDALTAADIRRGGMSGEPEKG